MCVPLTPVLRCVVAHINIAAHGRAVSIATPSHSKSLHGLAELRLLHPKHSGVEQLVEESYTDSSLSTQKGPVKAPTTAAILTLAEGSSHWVALRVNYIIMAINGAAQRHLGNKEDARVQAATQLQFPPDR